MAASVEVRGVRPIHEKEIMTIYERFEQFQNDHCEFEKVEGKRSERPDLHALTVLDELFPDTEDMISGAEHDIIFLNVSLESLHGKVTDDTIQELVRCGVHVSEYECLAMFV